jgi:hypothetical protein
VITVSAIALVSLAATVWTATVVSIPRGYITACALLSIAVVWFAWWRPKITSPIAVVVASLGYSVLRREFYGKPGLLSAGSLQSIAIWTFAFAAAALFRFALTLSWRRSGERI